MDEKDTQQEGVEDIRYVSKSNKSESESESGMEMEMGKLSEEWELRSLLQPLITIYTFRLLQQLIKCSLSFATRGFDMLILLGQLGATDKVMKRGYVWGIVINVEILPTEAKASTSTKVP